MVLTSFADRLRALVSALYGALLPLLSWRNWLLAARVFWGAGQRYSRGAGISHGAAVAFFTALSLAPLLVVATKVMVLLLSRDAVQQQLLGYMSSWLGPQETQFLAELIQRALNTQYDLSLENRTAWIALVTTLIGATAVFIELRTALLGMATQPTETFSLWGLLKVRILAAAIVIGASFLLSVALLLQTASQMLVGWLSTRVELLVPVVQLADLLLGLFFIGLVFALLIRALSGLGMSKRHAAIAGGVGAILFMLGRYAIGWYIAHSATQSALGAAGSLTVILIWVYWTSQIFLFSGAIGIELTERSRPEPAPAAAESAVEPAATADPQSSTSVPEEPAHDDVRDNAQPESANRPAPA
ncbi:YihY/virulence factor BrkB family protein [Amphibiibacter pelophylacis]|uniref:YihY/virulence factor BrkB family protein n=1 Tax=Amphibiibacter pelophylacis TaxID=1799477 RepID=A0ACC6P256_9BURK